MTTASNPTNPDPTASALVLVEFQREWLDARTGLLRGLPDDPNRLDRAAQRAVELLAAARGAGVLVVHVGMFLTPGYPELAGRGPARFGLRSAIPRAGTWLAATGGSEFAPGFAPAAGEPVVRGRTGASAFSGSTNDLDATLRQHGVTDLYLAGFALHVCIESTLRHGHDLGYSVTVAQDACAAFTEAQQRHVLDEVVHHFGTSAPASVIGLAWERGRRSGAGPERGR